MDSVTVRAVRTVARHPKATLSVAGFAARRRRRTTKAILFARQTVDLYARLSDPAVQRELTAAASSFATAVNRAHDLGLARAAGDRKFANQRVETLDHLSKALAHAQNRRRNRLRHVGYAIGVSAVGAYGLWRLRA